MNWTYDRLAYIENLCSRVKFLLLPWLRISYNVFKRKIIIVFFSVYFIFILNKSSKTVFSMRNNKKLYIDNFLVSLLHTSVIFYAIRVNYNCDRWLIIFYLDDAKFRFKNSHRMLIFSFYSTSEL